MKNKIYKYSLLLVICCNTIFTIGQNTDTIYFTGTTSEILSGNIKPLVVLSSNYVGLNHEPVKALAKVKLDVGDVYHLGTLDFGIKVGFTMKGVDVSSNELFSEIMFLSINPFQPEQLFVYDFMGSVSNLKNIIVEINSVDRMDGGVIENPEITSFITNNLRLGVSYHVDYKVDVRATYQGVELAPVITGLGKIEGNRVQTFSWNNAGTKNFPDYQFQLLRLYNINGLMTTTNQISAKVDWEKALTIHTESEAKELTITIAEGTGFYIWRVRGIGTFYKGGISNPRNYGKWSTSSPQDHVFNDINLSQLTGTPYFLHLIDGDDNLNWIYSRVFSEGNKVSEQITYANNLQQVKQTQTYLKSTGKSLVSQTLTDYSGRPALSTIPVPVDATLNGYRQGFVKNEGDSLYTVDDFDANSNYKNPSKVNAGGAYNYFSDVNSDLTIPDAEGYPYTRTLFENSATGRPMEQSGVGKVHAIGSQIDNMGRTVKTYYCNPSDDELIRIFGDEAPKSTSVLKTVVIDANNTTSVTYTTNEGTVIATCLALHQGDTLLDLLGSEEEEFAVKNQTIQNMTSPNGFLSFKRVVFSDTTLARIGYEINCETLDFGCQSVTANCGYQLQFFIENINNNTKHESEIYNLDTVSCIDGYKRIDSVSNWTPPIPGNLFSPGTYIITKKIISVSNTDAQLQVAMNDVENGVEPLISSLTGWLENVTTNQGLSDFFLDVQHLSDMLEPAHEQNPLNNNQVAYDGIRTFPFLSGTNEFDSLVFDTAMHVRFDIVYVPGTTQPSVLTIIGGCCGPIDIPVVYVPPFTCYERDTLIDKPEKRPDFSGFLLATVGDDMTSAGQTFKDVCPGYTPASLNEMIYHMLTDQYYLGSTKLVNGVRVKADGSAILQEDTTVQYGCENLWDCWIASVNGYQEMLSLNGSGSISDSIDVEMDGDGTKHDDQVDESSEDGAGSGVIMQWIIDRAMSKRLREDTDPDAKAFNANLVTQFLTCAGYKFAKIIDPDDAGSSFVSPADSLVYYDPVNYNNDTLYMDFGNPTSTTDTLWMPYIKSPVFAFKYFEYGVDAVTPKYVPVEISNCYNDYSTLDPPICENVCSDGRSHLDWNKNEREKFYISVKAYVPFDAGATNPPDTSGFKICPLNLEGRYDSLMVNCDKNCDERRFLVQGMVEQLFVDNCYEIGGCPDDDNVIMPSDISAIVNGIIDGCYTQCHVIDSVAKAHVPPYPFCEQEITCQTLDLSTGQLFPVNVVYPRLLPDCGWEQYNQIKYWIIELALDGIESKCDTIPNNVEWWGDLDVSECPESAPAQPNTRSKTYKVEANVN